VTNTVYFWSEPLQVLENGLGLEESLVFLRSLVSPLNKEKESTVDVVNNYDFNVGLPSEVACALGRDNTNFD
jgi:hypothetical protein